jgi:predicted glycosyltransferase
MKILNTADIQPARLSDQMEQSLHHPENKAAPSVDFDGAANAARFLDRWVAGSVINV